MIKTALILVEAFTAVVFVGLSLPLIFNKVPPNEMYGVRVRKTLANEDIWYKANAYFGKDFLIANIAVLLFCVAIFLLKDRVSQVLFLVIVSTVPIIPYTVVVVRTLVYVRKL